MTSTEERFFAKVDKNAPNGCWLWTASRFAAGYGQFRYSPQKNGRAHSWSYEHFKGPIPEGLQIDHLCKNKLCVNPDHLEAVTAMVNVHRSNNACAVNARKTHCPQGHAYSLENTYVDPAGRRICRACSTAAKRAWAEANREKLRAYHREWKRRSRERARSAPTS